MTLPAPFFNWRLGLKITNASKIESLQAINTGFAKLSSVGCFNCKTPNGRELASPQAVILSCPFLIQKCFSYPKVEGFKSERSKEVAVHREEQEKETKEHSVRWQLQKKSRPKPARIYPTPRLRSEIAPLSRPLSLRLKPRRRKRSDSTLVSVSKRVLCARCLPRSFAVKLVLIPKPKNLGD